jgi:hypothetical protein
MAVNIDGTLVAADQVRTLDEARLRARDRRASGRRLLFMANSPTRGAKRDLLDIQSLSRETSFDSYLEPAKEIIALRERECRCVANALRHEIALDVERTLNVYPDKDVATLLFDEAQLLRCLSAPSDERL